MGEEICSLRFAAALVAVLAVSYALSANYRGKSKIPQLELQQAINHQPDAINFDGYEDLAPIDISYLPASKR